METISFSESLRLENPLYIDLRTPGEFEKGSIPGAINIPVFSDEERKTLGWEYKNISPKKARISGLQFISPKLPEIIDKIDRIRVNGQVVLFCWRGGLRSQAIQQAGNLLDIQTYRIKGGYKEFRKYVLEFFKNYQLPGRLITLHGLTGSGKTKILSQLAQKNYKTLDLEKMAGHRGSVFGHLGIKKYIGQKEFDACLWKKLVRVGEFSFLIIEGESKRIGSIYLPDFLLGENRDQGVNIFISTSLEKRVEYILEEYSRETNLEDLAIEGQNCLQNIEKRVRAKAGNSVFVDLQAMLEKKEFFHFILVLLRDYYDPLYSAYLKNFGNLTWKFRVMICLKRWNKFPVF